MKIRQAYSSFQINYLFREIKDDDKEYVYETQNIKEYILRNELKLEIEIETRSNSNWKFDEREQFR